MTPKPQKYGSAALIGLPNAGKSTLTNALVGAKVSIVTAKKQTTRCRITGIMVHEPDNAQIVLLDTPGIFNPETPFDKAMVAAAWETLDDTDMVLHIVDATAPVAKNRIIIERLPAGKRALLVLNKIDLLQREKLLQVAQNYNDAHPYAATFMISALKENGLEQLKSDMAQNVEEGDWVYEGDDITTMPMRFMAAEITREKIFKQLHRELPYSIFVETENWEKFDNGSIKIMQVITVEKDSQKAIVLGKGGSRIKQIGEAARIEIENNFGIRAHLKLFVKTQKNWADKGENHLKIGL